MTIIVASKGVYGRELFYPTNAAAEAFTRLLGRTSLTRAQLQIIKELGFSIVVEAPPVAQI